MLVGIPTNSADRCHPALSMRRMPWAPGATIRAISARCRFIASVLHAGKIRAAPSALFRADGTEDVGRGGALITRSARAGCRASPTGGLSVLWPIRASSDNVDFYLVAVDRFLARDCIQARGEAFLKRPTTPSAWA